MNENYQPQISGSATITVRLEYVWTDGYSPANLRSKVRYEHWTMDSNGGQMNKEGVLARLEPWKFDGSSTLQAEGEDSDVIIRPVNVYHNPLEQTEMASFLVLCDTWNPDGTPHETNSRVDLSDTLDDIEESDDMWFSVEQEYTFLDEDSLPCKWNQDKIQGENYCGVGSQNVTHRFIVDQHAMACISAGIDISGTNAEVLVSQWEYQLGPKGAMTTADDLLISRYLLQKMTEGYDFSVSFHPKPIEGEWNGAGAHINFSTEYMRETPDRNYIESVCDALAGKHEEHMEVYGEDNEKRLTGTCETQHYDKFSYGVSDRGASIRIPTETAMEWKGYLEDRRPSANVDPYEAFSVLVETISSVKVPENATV